MREERDVVVLGAGMIGVSVAVQLQRRGLAVALVDRQPAGLETSFGNAGVIQTEAVLPYLFPRKITELLSYAFNRSAKASYHPLALPAIARPFIQYWKNSSPARALSIADARASLIQPSGSDHLELATLAGEPGLLRATGWTQVYDDRRAFEAVRAEAELVRDRFGIAAELLAPEQLAEHEPGIRRGHFGAVHWPGPLSVRDPVHLTRAYQGLFERLGGVFRTGDARSLKREDSAWRVAVDGGSVSAPTAVVALGPWSNEVTKLFGYAPPMFMQRGYHMNFAVEGEHALRAPVLDGAGGYVLAPMRSGIRLTTGAEFALHDAPATPVQLARTEPAARRFLPALRERLDDRAWLGSRPCLPDMLPIIGPAPGCQQLWLAYGHGHQGFTLGPTTGRLLAEMITGAAPFTDPAPYRADRF